MHFIITLYTYYNTNFNNLWKVSLEKNSCNPYLNVAAVFKTLLTFIINCTELIAQLVCGIHSVTLNTYSSYKVIKFMYLAQSYCSIVMFS